MTYDEAQGSWGVELRTPNVSIVWRLTIDGGRLTGTGKLLPGKETVREVEAKKD